MRRKSIFQVAILLLAFVLTTNACSAKGDFAGFAVGTQLENFTF